MGNCACILLFKILVYIYRLARGFTKQNDLIVHEDAFLGNFRSLKAASPRLGAEQKGI